MTALPAFKATSPSPILLRETIDGGVAVLTLNRPAARNSLSLELINDLHAALDLIGRDDGVRAVVIAANGPVFSAGHDMKELTAHRNDADRGRASFTRIMTACS
ncbi:enoyl-CoA hydratase/isomerase family protein, partial [Rhodopseudomonas palustris]|nr:enoyl-CoA hydratase/isomerase family protein [Rhodopseudomonas palustris]